MRAIDRRLRRLMQMRSATCQAKTTDQVRAEVERIIDEALLATSSESEPPGGREGQFRGLPEADLEDPIAALAFAERGRKR